MGDFDEPLGQPQGLRRVGTDFVRDAWGTPHVACPNGTLVKSGPRKGLPKMLKYGRPSGLNKQIEPAFALGRWSERQIVYGMTVPDDELTASLVRLAELQRDSDAAKDLADGIAVRAKTLAKANLAADRGTHVHAATEDVDLDRSWVDRAADGEVLGLDLHVQAAMLQAWDLFVVAYDLEVLGVEVRVVHDNWRQAGTLDRIVRLTRDLTFANGVTILAGTVMVLDVKTGKLQPAYWHGYSVQCAAYAGALPYETATDERSEWPWAIDQQWALIAHLPVDEAMAGRATCRMVLADIASGRETVERLILPARRWQARRDLFVLAHDDEPAVRVEVAEPEPVKVERSVRHDFGVAAEPVPSRPRVDDEGDPITDEQVAEIKARAKALHPEALAVLDVLARSARDADRAFSIAAGPSRRRWHIYRALLRLGVAFGGELEQDHVRATLAVVVPDVAQPAVPLGPAIGSLTLDEAMAFVRAAIAVIEQQPALTFAEDGGPSWAGVALPD